MAGERTHRVTFECGHIAHIFDFEHGDGSAWCQACGAFRCYGPDLLRIPCQEPELSGLADGEAV